MRCAYIAALGWTLAACGGAATGLDLHFDARASTWSDVVQRVTTAAAQPAKAPVVLSISRSDPPLLIAHDAAQREIWRSITSAGAALHVAGASVLTVESDSLVVRDVESGERMFARSLAGMSLLGAARDGDTLAWISAAPSITETAPRSSIVVADARTGNVRWERTVDAALGAPVLRGGVLLAPWNRQGLTAIDSRDGHEIARLHADEISVDWIDTTAAGIVYGSEAVHDLRCAEGDAACEALPSPLSRAPSRPTLHRSGYRATERSGIRSVFNVARSAAGQLSYVDDRAYLIFYRYVLAFDAAGGLVWVRMLDPDILNAQSFAGGLVLLDETGRLTRLRAVDGATLSQSPSMGQWQSAEWSGSASALSESERTVERSSETLQHGLLALTLDPDNRLVIARAYAADALSRDPDPVVTQQLLDAYEQRSTPSGMRTVIAQALLSRRTGGDHLVSALARHHDFLDEVSPPPLSVVIPSLIAMKERRAVPGLIDQLRDPATSAADLVLIASALKQLADRTVVRPIVDWLRFYRASATIAGHPDAVVALARAATALSEADAWSPLDTLARADGTLPVIAAGVTEVLRAAHAAPAVADTSVAVAQPTVARELEQRRINEVFAGRIDALRECIIPELARNPNLMQVRIVFVARSDGSVHGFAYAPSGATFAKCVAPVTQGITLPPFSGESTVASYVMQLRAPSRPAAPPVAVTDDPMAEWWSWYARESLPAVSTPWWNRFVEHDLDWLPIEALPGTTPTAATLNPETPNPETPSPVAPNSETPAATTPAPVAADEWWLPANP